MAIRYPTCPSNLNSLLEDIYVKYLRLQAFDIHYRVFDAVFYDLHSKMKEADPYYYRYSSTVQYAGSFFHKLRIRKPDEFDMLLVIRLPLNIYADCRNPNESDIILEPKSSGYVQLRMGKQFQRLPKRFHDEWIYNKAAYEWLDSRNYLLRTKFIEWFEGVVAKALNKYTHRYNKPTVYVDSVPYTIYVTKSKFSPAITLHIRDLAKTFQMDIDLVPALKFPENRWPISKAYRPIPPQYRKGYFMLVPKPNKKSNIEQDGMRTWRMSLHNQERMFIHNSCNLKKTIKLMKALRDSLGMHDVASYYINTLFLWETEKIKNKRYWRTSPALLFTRMVVRLFDAMVDRNIPYFWNPSDNLIGNVPEHVLTGYANKLLPLMDILREPNMYKLVAKYLLNSNEFRNYNAKILHL